MRKMLEHGMPIPSEEQQRSFSDLFLERFEKDIRAALKGAVEKDGRRLIRIKLKHAGIYGAEGETALIGIPAECVTEKGGIIRSTLCLVTARSGAEDGFGSVKIREIFLDIGSADLPKTLPDSLVPVIPMEDLDRTAEKLLAYFCPFLLMRPGPVPVESIAKRLGLTIRYECIDPKRELLGAIFFSDAAACIFTEGKEPRFVPIKRKTILVNCRAREDAQSRNTILHECLHWILHRFAFVSEKELQRSGGMIACRRSRAESTYTGRTDRDLMEWQANSLAPRMLLPASVTRIYADWWLERLDQLPEKLKMERLIERISARFQTSRTLTKIRLMELGYENAKLAFTYTDRKQYEISPGRILCEYQRNEAFQKALASGRYVYAESCFVIKDRRFLERAENGELRLTRRARQNREECCLAFVQEHRPIRSKEGFFRGYTEDMIFLKGSEAKENAAVVKELTEIMQNLPATFCGTLSAHMERKRYTDMRLADASLLSAKSIHRYRTDPNQNISMGSSVALCVGLHLHSVLSYNMVEKTPNRFTATMEHTAYQIILQTMTYKSIYECNEFLKQLGLKPLTKKEE